MSSGVFGTVRPAKIDPSRDVEILYYFAPSRGETSTEFNGYKRLEPSECLVPVNEHNSEGTIINGLYRLRLPIDKFSNKGVYTIYVRPKECVTRITDVSVLAAYPDVKGVILNTREKGLSGINTNLVGYRMEFDIQLNSY